MKVLNLVDEWEVSILGQGIGIGACTLCTKCPYIAFAERRRNPVVTVVELEKMGESGEANSSVNELKTVQFNDLAKLAVEVAALGRALGRVGTAR